jgi:hypothetical protein
MPLKKITAYTVYANPQRKFFWVRVKLENTEETHDYPFENVVELNAFTELLRHEQYTYFDSENQNLVIGWEPTGEHAPISKK